MSRFDRATAVGFRAATHRATLGNDGLEWDNTSAEPDARYDRVLVVDALPSDARDTTATLRRWRQVMQPGAEIRIVEPTRPLRRQSRVRRVARGAASGEQTTRDTVLAIRDAGWTIAAIERFVDEQGSWWIDARLLDLPAIVAATPTDATSPDENP